MIAEITRLLRSQAATWAAAALLPIPVLLVTDPARSVEISCVYLGLGAAWLATEILRSGGYPETRFAWRAKIAAICVALSMNAALFIALGLVVSVRSNIPFPLMAAFAVIPSIGLVPWMTLRIREPFKALVLSAFILMASKLAACVVARIVYGPDYIEHGYVAADWRTAKLMISLTWISITMISLGMLIYGDWQFEPLSESASDHTLAADTHRLTVSRDD